MDCSSKKTAASRTESLASAEDVENALSRIQETQNEEKEIDLRCGSCEDRFVAKYLDAKCPNCGDTTNIYIYKAYPED